MKTKTKRLQVTLELDVPASWTIGETDQWLSDAIRARALLPGWRPNVEIGEQRMAPKAGGK